MTADATSTGTRTCGRGRVVVAATGFGKSHLVERAEIGGLVLRATDLVDDSNAADLSAVACPTVVVESLHRLGPAQQDSLVQALVHHPGTTSFTLVSRSPLTGGLDDTDLAVDRIGPDELRLSAGQLHRLVTLALGRGGDATDEGARHRIVDVLTRLTDGWPALVELALAQGTAPWAHDADPLEWLSRPHGPVTRWVETRLLPSLPDDARRLLLLARDLRPFPRELAAREDHGEAWDLLCDTGVVTAGEEPRVVRLVAACLARRSCPPAGAAGWWASAARHYLEQELPGPALRAARYADDVALCRQVIEEHGDVVIASGWAEELLAAVDTMPTAHLDLRTRILQGHAARIAGRPQQAERVLEAVLVDTASWGEPPPPDLAWRLAAVKYGAAEFRAARELCTGVRIPLPAGEPPAARGMRLATLALTHWMLGDDEAAGRAAAESLASARAGDDEARATAHLAQSLLLDRRPPAQRPRGRAQHRPAVGPRPPDPAHAGEPGRCPPGGR